MKVTFAEQMDAEIAANQGKGDWANWKPTPAEANRELRRHCDKIQQELASRKPDAAAVRELSADIGNIAKKIFDEFG